MKKKPVLIAIIFVVVVLGAIIYSSMNLSKYQVEVCMTFNGQTSCRTASGTTKDETLQTAVTNACADIAGGVTDSIACERTEPTKETWLK
jgi:Flp pilus assembly protein TadG